MSRLIARLMLSLFMLPIAAVMFIVAMVVGFEVFGSYNDLLCFGFASAVTTIFVVVYWIALWYHTVTWSRRRVRMTMIVSAVALAIGSVAGIISGAFEPSFGVFVGSAAVIFAWLIGTVFAWRETSDERIKRIRAAGTDAISCVQCGYNLTGLRQTACPECGATPTLNELYAAQPQREETEFSASE